jgi:hypothetical protein
MKKGVSHLFANSARGKTNEPAKRPHPGLTREEAARRGLVRLGDYLT